MGAPFTIILVVTVINIGNRDVVIQNWGFDLDDGTKTRDLVFLSDVFFKYNCHIDCR